MQAIQDFKYNHSCPRVNLINQASDPLPFKLPDLAKSLQTYIDEMVYPAWGVKCTVVTEEYKAGDWPLVFSDEYSINTT